MLLFVSFGNILFWRNARIEYPVVKGGKQCKDVSEQATSLHAGRKMLEDWKISERIHPGIFSIFFAGPVACYLDCLKEGLVGFFVPARVGIHYTQFMPCDKIQRDQSKVLAH